MSSASTAVGFSVQQYTGTTRDWSPAVCRFSSTPRDARWTLRLRSLIATRSNGWPPSSSTDGDAASPSHPPSTPRNYPQWAEQILEFFPALELMEGLKPGSADHTASLDAQANGAHREHPEQLGEYRILREIGHGGMGVVYEAIQESLGRRVALKILPLHGRIDPIQMERFQLEARSAARLHHAGIVPVHGVGEHDGVHFYVMQYIQGHGLDVILDDLRRLRDGAPARPLRPSVTRQKTPARSPWRDRS